ncbi:MAG: hypothetical protein M3O30_01300 [Planctomycetota bacterium]|nr:hypothetical protein [Planctomycetota bacterium]
MENTTQLSNLGDYQITSVLTPDQTFLGTGPTGRMVVLKLLGEDCLLRGKLHPSIRDRLARIRELAHVGVANLYGVERIEKQAFCVWEYIAGHPLNRAVARLDSPDVFVRLIRETILAVEAMHSLGIVHGQIHAGNVIVDDLNRIHLTHLSPLLYDDPQADAVAVCEMVRTVSAASGWQDCSIARAATIALADEDPLLHLRVQISATLEFPTNANLRVVEHVPREKPPGIAHARLGLVFAAAAIAVAGLILAGLIILYASRSAPKKPVPPQAPPGAFQSLV